MAAAKADISAMRQTLNQAKTRKASFAFCPGRKGDDVFLVDIRRGPDLLAREARAESSGTKTASGYFTVDGTEIQLEVIEDIPRLDRQIKDWLRDHGLKFFVSAASPEPVAKVKAADEPAKPEPEKGLDRGRVSVARKGWDSARQKAAGDIKALVLAISAATRNSAGVEDAGTKARGLTSHLAPLDGRLGKVLDQLAKTPDATAQNQLAGAAGKLVKHYVTLMDSEFFRAVDNNGFAPTAIRATVLASLKQVEDALRR